MSKKSVLVALGVLGVVVTGGIVVAVRRSRSEPPPISPTVPRVQDVDSAEPSAS